ncbi:FAD-binding oxidoreductase [Microbacterium gorillae]|uniref:FAD-binding oxidoreductase n=1 Tax=Microbacterium gorillae TaxID=1231063 RepID=UPI00058ABE29|nr:FAD-binding oxidoreductase [Microbacterium gorillae]
MATSEQVLDTFTNDLRAAIAGEVYTPADAEYDAKAHGFQQVWKHTAPFLVDPRDENDVAAAVRLATAHGLPVSPLGHNHGYYGPITEGVLIRTIPLASVTVDPEAGTAVVGAGTTWGEVAQAAAVHGFTPSSGQDPSVGVVGFLLGGGLGAYTRTYGYGADHVRSMRVVLADGSIVEASDTENTELFWALRGGNSGFGCVVSVTIELLNLPAVQAETRYYAADDIPVMFRAWARWIQDLPASFNPLGGVEPMPDEENGGETMTPVLMLRIVHVGDEAEFEDVLATFPTDAEPMFVERGEAQDQPVEEPFPVREGAVFLRELPEAAVDTIIDALGADSLFVAGAIQVLGGATEAPDATATAVAARDARYAFYVATMGEVAFDPAAPVAFQKVADALAPWASAEVIPNFNGGLNRMATLTSPHAGDKAERLAAVRAAVDPTGTFARQTGVDVRSR